MTGTVAVVGSFNVDHVWHSERLPRPGETLAGIYTTGPGGKGFNQAVAARRAGAGTVFVCALGDDSGTLLARALAKADGIALRVPVVAGSLVDITFISRRETTAQEVNKILTDAALSPRWQGIFTVSNEQLVSSDIIGTTYASIADLPMTRVIGNLVKVLAWYDNEMGYAHTLLRHVKGAGKHI